MPLISSNSVSVQGLLSPPRHRKPDTDHSSQVCFFKKGRKRTSNALISNEILKLVSGNKVRDRLGGGKRGHANLSFWVSEFCCVPKAEQQPCWSLDGHEAAPVPKALQAALSRCFFRMFWSLLFVRAVCLPCPQAGDTHPSCSGAKHPVFLALSKADRTSPR